MTISNSDREKVENMKKQLTAIGSKEHSFIKVELLFYAALDLARTYGEDETTNELLAALKRVQGKEYAHTKELFRKAVQREKVIRQFMAAFRSALTTIGKKPSAFSQQENKESQL